MRKTIEGVSSKICARSCRITTNATYSLLAFGLLSTFPIRTSIAVAGHIRERPLLVQPLISLIFRRAILFLGLRRSTLHQGFGCSLVREYVLAFQALFAFPSTARDANPSLSVEDCLVGFPLAMFP